MSAMEHDFYELLGVDRNADAATIKSAYRKLAMQYHPDRNGGCKENEDKFKAISAAYECLKDPQKRAAYDRYGHAAFTQGGAGGPHADFGDLGDIFETIFGSAFGGGRTRPRRGADLRYDLQVELEDAFHGRTSEIKVEVSVACEPCGGSGAEAGTSSRRCALCRGQGKVRAQQGFFVIEKPCPNCHGRGEVIEKPCRACRAEGRAATGTPRRRPGRGEAGRPARRPGDLYCFVHVQPHPVRRREGTSLSTRAPLSFTTAALGGTSESPGPAGEAHAIDIPAGIQSG